MFKMILLKKVQCGPHSTGQRTLRACFRNRHSKSLERKSRACCVCKPKSVDKTIHGAIKVYRWNSHRHQADHALSAFNFIC